jgi:TPR repeat protein
MSTYPLQHPVRTVAATEAPASFPATVRLRTRTHLSIVVPPGPETGPTALHVPLTGHNVVLEIVADAGEEVVLERVRADHVTTSGTPSGGAGIAMRELVPPFSADFVEPVLRAVSAYEPLAAPDFEIDLATGEIREPAGFDRPRTPRVAAGESARFVFAPITDVTALVRYTLVAQVAVGGRTAVFSWELVVTAATSMVVVDGPGPARSAPVHRFFPDHWHPGGSWQAIDSGTLDHENSFSPFVHTGADGSGFLLRPPIEVEPESRAAEKSRVRAERHAAKGKRAAARAAFTTAAEAGSVNAAYRLALMVDADGDTEAAIRWYTVAAQGNHPLACNDLAGLHCRRGDLDEAEHWYRRGMDTGDWTAAFGWGSLLKHRGHPDAEAVLRMVAGTPAGRAAEVVGDHDLVREDRMASALAAAALADLLITTGRAGEATGLLEESAAKGNPHAADSLANLCEARGDLDEAKRWWRTAAEAGVAASAYQLGTFLQAEGDQDGAEQWWARAAKPLPGMLSGRAATVDLGAGRSFTVGDLAESSEVQAAYALGRSLRSRGQDGRKWLELAARAGHSGARSMLAGAGPARMWDEHMLNPLAHAVRHREFLALPEPGWKPGGGRSVPPLEATIGIWEVDARGRPGPFRPNAYYRHVDEALPTDPLHVLLRQLADGRKVRDKVLALFAGSYVEVRCTEANQVQIWKKADVRFIDVVTAQAHKQRMERSNWVAAVGAMLHNAAPAGVEIWVNRGDPAQFRFRADVLRRMAR